jgi:hypothetical protein
MKKTEQVKKLEKKIKILRDGLKYCVWCSHPSIVKDVAREALKYRYLT